ncbi:MAG TPA: response regulator [Gemmataceae bacterium]|jgi:CheY-like chemotaxis protein/anti-sigma regulatory factor (Ser/Thr protein kinase)|nr:response regulator [Gemmataceae bacterium]
MATVLVVDDSPVDRLLAGRLLEKPAEPLAPEDSPLAVLYAGNGEEAMAAIAQHVPDLVITDLLMPEMNGLELVRAVRGQYPALPVMLMTAFGSEDIALQALQSGAVGYVSKRHLAWGLARAVHNVLEVSMAARQQEQLSHCFQQTESRLVLDNDPALIPPLLRHLEENLKRMQLCDGTGLLRVAVALREALINAIHHGNLEVGSDAGKKGEGAYRLLVEERRRLEPYRNRRVHVTALESRLEAVYVVRDEGTGFDPARVPDSRDPASLEISERRGLMLIRNLMDEVYHNETGNQITLIKRADVRTQAP